MAEVERDSGELSRRPIGSSGHWRFVIEPNFRVASIQIEIPNGRTRGLVLGLFEGFSKFAVEQLRLDLLVIGALTEQGFAALGFLLQKLRGKVQVRPLVLLHWRLVEQDFSQFCVNRQRSAAARADYFELSRFMLAS